MEASEDGARDDGDEAASESTSATPPTRFSAAAGHLEWPYWSKIDEAGFRQYISPSRFYVELRPIIEHVVAASAFATSPPVHEVYFYEDHARIGFPIANRDGVTLYDLVKTLCDRSVSDRAPSSLTRAGSEARRAQGTDGSSINTAVRLAASSKGAGGTSVSRFDSALTQMRPLRTGQSLRDSSEH